jgi:hypothetical protein
MDTSTQPIQLAAQSSTYQHNVINGNTVLHSNSKDAMNVDGWQNARLDSLPEMALCVLMNF